MAQRFIAAATLLILINGCDTPRGPSTRGSSVAAAESTRASGRDTSAAVVTEGTRTPSVEGSTSRSVLEARGEEVLRAFAARDGARLAELVHPSRGVRFSPYAYVQRDSDVVIPRDSVARLFTDRTRRMWGRADGTGDPIELTFPEYFTRYVYDVDFLKAPRRAFNSPPLRAGNTPSNLNEVYPGAQWLEYHFPGFDPQYDGMDWRSLWLVFEPLAGQWYLVGVVHGSWTI